MRKKLAVAAVTFAVVGAGAGFVGGGSPVSADPLCYSVATKGTVIGQHQLVGPICPDAGTGTGCETETVGIDPSALVSETACTPRVGSAARP